MEVTQEGLALIKRFEGFRGTAYRCPAGVWTIGYGHTAMAGPPTVAGGMQVSREEAQAILLRDVEAVAREVRVLLKRELSARQFSALVSFAYNVGTGNFRSSSVLKAVNAGDLAAVPRRLQLWTKANGRVLPGLVMRRAAEAALFLATDEPPPARVDVEPNEGKPLARSSTVLAALLSILAGLASAIANMSRPLIAAAVFAAIMAAALWVIRERRRKAREEGV
jgi:lysozyme